MSPSPFRPETNLQEALARAPEVAEAFKRLGLKCVDCVAAEKETFRHAALYHEKSLDEILKELNGLKLRDEPARKD